MDSSSSPLPLRSAASAASPSSPLSRLSTTPSLPSSPAMQPDATGRYPSPMSSSTLSGTQSPIKLGDPVADDNPRPVKKRRLAPPRDRSTTYLDLMKPDEDCTHEDKFHLQRLLSALKKKKKVVVIAGAGISVSAGIPDFRSSTGLFATARSQHKLKASGKHLFDASVYKHDSSTHSFHTMVREMAHLTKNASPTPFHHLLASLANEGRLLRLYSQNIDCLDTSMPPLRTSVPLGPKGPWPPTIQLHGGLQNMVCTKCTEVKPFNADLFDGPEAPLCESCKVNDEVRTTFAGKRSHGIGRLRPRFVLYNEFNPDEEAIGNVARADLKARPDAVIVVGTTLKVPGTRRLVKEMCQVARGRRDGLTAWINIDPEPKGTEFKDCWDLVVRSKCDDVAKLAELPPFDCEPGDDCLVSQEQYESLRNNGIEVNIPFSPVQSATEIHTDTTPKQDEAIQAIPTPRSSPPASVKKAAVKSTQTKIAFGSKNTAERKQPAKPRTRKPKQPTKAKAPPKATVTQAFKAGKNITGRDADHKLGITSISDVPKVESEITCALPPLRPERRSSADSLAFTRESSDEKAINVTPGTSPLPVLADMPLAEPAIEPPSKLHQAVEA
ncbi:hypothetical protein HIM_04016 [Hirsutella minnesotensis 3608]|uniref:Deacetylase sirtuin-type domain-containing protein n=1 Tax=Hirsutella minnesotensis 3608 TaxID=1043627 RepID=A0A0F7ZQ59_9HYPO|nr:hypothetical protein HIM_04016 [Hirsutella minnesotensis 3608]